LKSRIATLTLKRNVVANYVGQGWRALMNLAFVPLYVKYLGMEAYGLIGIFTILQVCLSVFDSGLRPALGREMARFTAGAHNAQSIRDLLRSIEIVALVVSTLIALGVWAASDWIAVNWVMAERLSPKTISRAFAIMGVVVALRLLENVYVGAIVGLQRQVLENAVSSVMATLRGLGAVAVLAWISPTITAFFVLQGLVSIATVLIFLVLVYRHLPPAARSGAFSQSALLAVWRFAGGMVLITFLATLLTQSDKLVLSRILPLEAFSLYALASVVANSLLLLTGPVATALLPRLIEHVAVEDHAAVRRLYHDAAQLVSVTTGSAAVVLIVFSDRVLKLWTGNVELAERAGPLLSVMALGTLFNALMCVPYQTQIAHGWTSLTIRVNAVAVAVLVPAILLLVPHYGAIAAAWIWVTLNAGYLTFAVGSMHRRLLKEEKWSWYGQDVLLPLCAAAAAGIVCRWVIPDDLGIVAGVAVLLLTAACVFLAAALSAPAFRYRLLLSRGAGVRYE
jgi:O-antigen/teichoic acid export membrane protein